MVASFLVFLRYLAPLAGVAVGLYSLGVGVGSVAEGTGALSLALSQSLTSVFLFNLGMTLLANARPLATFFFRKRKYFHVQISLFSLILVLLGSLGIGYTTYRVSSNPVYRVVQRTFDTGGLISANDKKFLDVRDNPNALHYALLNDRDKKNGYPSFLYALSTSSSEFLNTPQEADPRGYTILALAILDVEVDKLCLLLEREDIDLLAPVYKGRNPYNCLGFVYSHPLPSYLSKKEFMMQNVLRSVLLLKFYQRRISPSSYIPVRQINDTLHLIRTDKELASNIPSHLLRYVPDEDDDNKN